MIKHDEAGARLRRGLLLADFEKSGETYEEFAGRLVSTESVERLITLARQERDETTEAIGEGTS